MKKRLILLSAVLFMGLLLTGCGSQSDGSSKGGIFGNSGTKTCTKTSVDEDGYNTTDTMVITYKKDKVTVVEDTNISETDPDYIDFSLNFGTAFAEKLSEVNGFDVKYSKEGNNKIKMYMKVDFNKIDVNDIKDKLGDLYSEDDAFYSKNDITIDDFINENLSDYTCK